MNVELRFLDFLQKLHHPIIDRVMIVISLTGEGSLIWLAAAAVMAFKKKQRDRLCALHIVIALVLNLLIVNVWLKPLVSRIRPFMHQPLLELLIKRPADASFPSGHTSSSFAAAGAIFLHNKKWGRVAFAYAALMGLSRMYLYVHYPSDVAAGAVIGVLMALLAGGLIKRLKKKV